VKNVLITGAEGGIGTALCRTFKKSGYRVIASDVKKITHKEYDEIFRFDLHNFCAQKSYRDNIIREIIKSLEGNGLSVLLNNAAVQILRRIEKIKRSEFHSTLNVNVLAPFLLAQKLLSELEMANGSVINIASIHSMLTKPEFVMYATSKAALIGLTKALAVELGSRVRVNAIAPAATATPMLLDSFLKKEKSFDELSQKHPLGRIAEPEEIANVALFLASERASFITGTVVNVDGGISSRLHDPN